MCLSHYCNPFLSIQSAKTLSLQADGQLSLIMAARPRGKKPGQSDHNYTADEHIWLMGQLRNDCTETKEMPGAPVSVLFCISIICSRFISIFSVQNMKSKCHSAMYFKVDMC